jgi:hypothetical protein
MSMTPWALEQALVTIAAQDAVEEVFKAAPSLVTYADELHEVKETLTKLCELLCLEEDFLEESEE